MAIHEKSLSKDRRKTPKREGKKKRRKQKKE